MSKKLATPAAVFATCEALEETGKPWNRDDVRHAIGGGGFNAIDPLIQAWRKLRPIKEIAPQTPTELLHLVAESIETHLSTFIQNVESRDTERAKAFETSTQKLLNNIQSMTEETTQLRQQLDNAQDKIENLQLRCESQSTKIEVQRQQSSKLQSENDELRGLTQRLEAQLTDEKNRLTQTINQLEAQHEQKIELIHSDYKQQLVQQKQDLIKINEQSENRLMRIIERERSEAKAQLKEKQDQLNTAKQTERDLTEKNTQLTVEAMKLTEQTKSLKASIAKSESDNDQMNELKSSLNLLTKKVGELEQPE